MSTRRSHFKACPLPGIFHRPTSRTELIKKLLREYRLMRTTHLIEFLRYFNESTSEQGTVRALRWLFDIHEVVRIKKDPDSHMVAEGSLPKIYGLNTRANRELNEHPKRVSRVVPHALEVANSIVWGVVRPCRESKGGLRFIDAPDIVQSMGTARAKATAKPYTWPVEFTYRGKTTKSSLTPDRLFGTIATATSQAWFYLLEEDRTSEPEQRDDYSLSGTSIFRKLLCYVFLYHLRVLEQIYGIKGFRILLVTDSKERIKNMLVMWEEANKALKEFQKQSHVDIRPVPHNVFLCVDRATLRAGTIFTVPWTNGRGEQVTIDPLPSVAPQLSAVG